MEKISGTEYILPTLNEDEEISFNTVQRDIKISDDEHEYRLLIPSRQLRAVQSVLPATSAANSPKSPIRSRYEIPCSCQESSSPTFRCISGAAHSISSSNEFKMFQIKVDTIPVPIHGYSLIPQPSNENPSSDRKGHGVSCGDDVPTPGPPNTANFRRVSAGRSRRLGKDLSMTFHTTVSSLVRTLCDDAAFDSKTYAVNVVHAFWRGKMIAACTLPTVANWKTKCLCILFEVKKKNTYGRGRAVCIRYCLDRVESETIIRLHCSCWEDENSSCFHSEDLDSALSVRKAIKNFLDLEKLGHSCFSEAPEILSSEWGVWKSLPVVPIGDRKYTYWISFCLSPRNGEPPLFVPVIQYNTSFKKKANHSLLQCQDCRQSPHKRGYCDHETAVLHAMNLERENVSNEAAETYDNVGNAHVEQIDADEDMDDEVLEIKEDKYMATRPRPVLSCPSDAISIREIIHRVYQCQCRGLPVHIKDELTSCSICKTEFTQEPDVANVSSSVCEVTMHTLGHGSVPVFVTDFYCLSCRKINYFDGFDTGLFSATSKTVYCRDLLDFWLYHTAGLGGTFRSAYELSKVFSNSSTLNAFKLGQNLTTRRRSASTCFSAFLRTLSVPEGQDLAKLFDCQKCQDSNGRFSGIVMDGTATGILGKLPNFDRPSVNLPSARNSSLPQFVLQNAKMRRFMEKFCSSAKYPDRKGLFTVAIGNGSRHSDWDAAEILFNATQNEHQTIIVREFLDAVFECFPRSASRHPLPFEEKTDDNLSKSLAVLPDMEIHHEGQSAVPKIDSDTNKTDNGDSTIRRHGAIQSQDRALVSPPKHVALGVNGNSKFRHRLPSIKLRNHVTDFTRCFTTSSVPGTLYRTNDACVIADALSTALIALFNCCHENQHSSSSIPCLKCVNAVLKNSRSLESHCPSAAVLACGLAEYFVHHQRSTGGFQTQISVVKEAARRMGYLLDEAWETRKLFMLHFSKGEARSTKEYNENYARAVSNDSSMFGTELPHRSGEFFPGRPLCRPRVSFVSANFTVEASADKCTKIYKNSRSHSPGLFAVHCVCTNPKIIGISVMESSESLATAFSILTTRFEKLPCTVYYDNACNLMRSVILRSPWVLHETRLCCDRFHFKSHTCPSVFDPDSYKSLDDHRTSSAEAVNSSWAASRGHIRFLDGTNLMPFIIAKSVLINLRALFREETNVCDVEDGSLRDFGNTVSKCQCRRCVIESDVYASDQNRTARREVEEHVKKRKIQND